MSKRGNNEGSIYKRKDGRWSAALVVDGGKRRYLYGKTRQDVARKLNAALRDRELGLPSVQEHESVQQFLGRWLETARPALRRTTYKRYEQYVRLHMVPSLGNVRLSRLTPRHLQQLYTAKLEQGLSPTTVHHLHAVLHCALSRALKLGLVVRNVADAVDSPRPTRTEIQPLNPEQARRLLAAARGDRLEALYALALTTGMRQGELLAIRWRQADLDRGALQVLGTLEPDGIIEDPKSATGRRQITLTKLAIDALRRHRVSQNEERLAAGPAWTDLGLVFTNTVGGYLDANNLRHRGFPRLLEKAELPRMRFHDLRHSTATLLLSLGVHPKVVQELLGHSQISVTLDTYSHVLPNLHGEAMIEMDRLLAQ
jgi:integrase